MYSKESNKKLCEILFERKVRFLSRISNMNFDINFVIKDNVKYE